VTERVLTLRELNRATLARQMLLEPAGSSTTVAAVVGRLVGLQAQQASAPYVGLWTRLAGFDRDDLAKAIDDRSVVKATLMRGTLHLVTADDYPWVRRAIQPALAAAADSIATRRGGKGAFDPGEILAAGRRFFGDEPHTYAELSAMLSDLHPDVDIGSMRYTVRTHVPLVQVPTDTRWSYPGQPRFTLAEDWLGRPVPVEEHEDDDLRDLVRRYLAAFGPASVTDVQTWSGLPKLKEPIERRGLTDELVVHRDEQGRELLDLPDAPLPEADAPAPDRFLPEYDNLLLSHQKRTRVVADEHRKRVFLPGLRVSPTFLVDGFVAGTWKVEKAKGTATLVVDPFAKLPKASRDALVEQAEHLVRFVEPKAKSHAVRLAG
jgi:winged helix DNA-binding protein